MNWAVPLLLLSSTPPLIEVPLDDAKTVSVQICIKLPSLSEFRKAAIPALAQSMIVQTQTYPAPTLRAYASQTGEPLFAAVGPDCLRIGMSFPASQLPTALSMAASILMEPRFTEESLQQAISKARRVVVDPWDAILRPEPPAPSRMSLEIVTDLYREFVRPGAVAVAVAGKFEPGAARAAWEQKAFPWYSGRIQRVLEFPVIGASESRFPEAQGGELALPPVRLESPDAAVLGAIAYLLGGGKSASLHRTLRQALSISYRQEALLWPESDSMRIRILWAGARGVSAQEASAEARKALIAAVEGWTEADLGRARASARAALSLGIGPNLFRAWIPGPQRGTSAEEAFLRAYWLLNSGNAEFERLLVERMDRIELLRAKELAKQWLESAIAVAHSP
ncbi:MAG TPA: hypothetical protein PLA92_07895 [Fimbriimonadaceae bacterium]|nr:hypothetical protein [Fimbriimonadaceae bacterium]